MNPRFKSSELSIDPNSRSTTAEPSQYEMWSFTGLMLVLGVWWVQSQEITELTVDFVSEVKKIETLEGKVKSLEGSMQSQTTEMNSKLEELRKENEDLKLMIANLQKVNEERQVAFSASLFSSESGHLGPFTSVESPIMYKKVHTNFGNGYNPETGVFTVPVKGVYFLRLYAHSHAGVRMAVSLMRNGETQCSAYSHMPVTNGNGSNGIVLSLDKGDEIYTKLWENSWVYDDPAGYTSFGGFLLFPL